MPFRRAAAISWVSMLAITLAASCSSASTEESPESNTSAGADAHDSSSDEAPNDADTTVSTPDASLSDASNPADASGPIDSGDPVSDAAIVDSGTSEEDSASLPDSGTPTVDSGALVDTGVPFTPMSLSSADVTNGGAFAQAQAGSFGCGGSDLSPALSWTAGPTGTQSYAVVMRDLTVNYLHWALYNIPSSTLSIPKGVQLFQKNPAAVPGSTQAKNDSAFYGYQGPCPLAGPATHSYEISVYALNLATLASSADAPQDVLNEIAAHVQCPSGCKAQLVATFTKN